jgi:hypothetical protein
VDLERYLGVIELQAGAVVAAPPFAVDVADRRHSVDAAILPALEAVFA